MSSEGTGVEGAVVALYPADASAPSPPRPVAHAVSGAAGAFRLEAPAGTYVVVARLGNRFGTFGRNPVHLLSPQRGLHLPLVPAHPVKRRAVTPGDEAVEGRILRAGQPADGARAYIYLDLANGLRGPGYAVSEPTGADGVFRIPLTPGTYFLAARLRPAGRETGPLQPGDLFGVAASLPLTVREGEAAETNVELVELPPRERMDLFQGRFARLAGVVVDAGGLPAAGFRACVYDNPQMINQPAAVSEPTGADGRFTLEIPLTGTFYLGARERLGGPPARGERVGFYRGAAGGRIELATGSRLSDVRIVVQTVP